MVTWIRMVGVTTMKIVSGDNRNDHLFSYPPVNQPPNSLLTPMTMVVMQADPINQPTVQLTDRTDFDMSSDIDLPAVLFSCGLALVVDLELEGKQV